MQDIRRCVRCNLPENFPRLSIDEAGVCSLCRKAEKKKAKKKKYKGMDALKKHINKLLEEYPYERKYDCVIGCSGGRDSTYLMYWLKKVMGLNVLAITMTHDFLPAQTLKNINTVSSVLGVDVKYMENHELDCYGKQCVRAWSKNPIAPTLISFCTGCRHGLKKAIPQLAAENNIPILFMGNTPMEKITYRTDLISSDPDNPSRKNQALGYTGLLLKSPAFLLSPKSLSVQLKDFQSKKKKDKAAPRTWPVTIEPFFHYIEWKEEEVIPTITSLGWEYDKSLNSTWRSDCYVNLVRQYYYKRILGYNDLDVYYAKQIRTGQITKEDAMARIAKEGAYSPEMIAHVLKNQYDLDFDKIESKIAKKESKLK